MGGAGSGSQFQWWRGSKKATVEGCLSIDANRWTREGILKAEVHQSGSWNWSYQSGRTFSVNYEVNTLNLSRSFVRLWYAWRWSSSKEDESANYSLSLQTTRPRFGGLRWWFTCELIVNGRSCNRRVGKWS